MRPRRAFFALAATALVAATARADVVPRPCALNPDAEPVVPLPPLAPEPAVDTAAQRLGGAHEVRGREAPAYVAFTFDDGPSGTTTPEVLATLAAHDVPAAFFVVGARLSGERDEIRGNIEALRMIAAGGYLIGNHTLHHANLRRLRGAAIDAEIGGAERAIARVLHRRPYLFRPPYAALGGAGAYLGRHGYTVVRWTVDVHDFRESHGPQLSRLILATLDRDGGGIVLLHDTKPWTAAELPGILDDLQADNCRRLAAGLPLLLPVSLEYFLRERDGSPRPVSVAAAVRAARYRAGLPERCQARIDKAGEPH